MIVNVVLIFFVWYVIPWLPFLWPIAFGVFAVKKHRFSLRMLFVAVTVECLLLGLVVILNWQPDYEIRFVVPSGFHGVFVIVEDEDGVELHAERGMFTVNVPASRLVKVRSAWMVHRWHKESWEISDKQGIRRIADNTGVGGLPKGEIGVWGLGSVSRGPGTTFFPWFVGTADEASAVDTLSISVDRKNGTASIEGSPAP